jgi:nitroimidazol reductase NimA-like FMN-containing flavoprotein (pyridoxamine 5'-phosphate oxidase superfamily)
LSRVLDVLQSLLEEQRFGVLATREEGGQPYTSLVALVASADRRQLAFATLRATRKFANLQADPRVSVLLDNRGNRAEDLREAAAVTALGEARVTRGAVREELKSRLREAHPGLDDLLRSRSCAVLCIDVHRYVLVTRFQDVVDIDIEPAP